MAKSTTVILLGLFLLMPVDIYARDLPKNSRDDYSQIDLIIPKGEYNIKIPREATPGSPYLKPVTIGQDYFFFVAMGDAKAGYTFNSGNIEPVSQDDKFHQGFWGEGKFAYYLKGKIKGKYLITSSFDLNRDKKELFRNLDPDKYYPVYGDSSSVDYRATNTQGMFYLLVEWDKSTILWGNYQTGLTGTEFSQFNRSLYGAKIDLESKKSTKFGEPVSKFVAFGAKAQQKAAHNEFLGTGGSLYYLKNQDVIEGSEVVKLEVRDQVTGLVLAAYNLEESSDYQIDYSQGRIIFWQPIGSLADAASIISNTLLAGNPVYVAVDYEYETEDKYDQATYGLRLKQALSDYITLGGTYVSEELEDRNYQLKGTDLTLHLGPNIKVTGEYAESKSESMSSFISTDGGLTFTELATQDSEEGKAYGLAAEAYFLDETLSLTGYYKKIGDKFSGQAVSSQQGKEMFGAAAIYDLGRKTRFSLSYDKQKLLDGGNAQTQLQVGAQETQTTKAQFSHAVSDRLKLTAEYQHQEVKGAEEEFESETNRESDILAGQLAYKLNEKTELTLGQQAGISGDAVTQTSLGIRSKVLDRLSLRAKQAVGAEGSATTVGAIIEPAVNKDSKPGFFRNLALSTDYTKSFSNSGKVSDTVSLGANTALDEKTELRSTYSVTDSGDEGKTQSFTYGSTRQINENLEFSADRSYALNDQENISTNIFGLSGDISDKWAGSFSYQRGIVQNHDGSQDKRNAVSIGLGFADKDKKTNRAKVKFSTKFEFRRDDGQTNERQFLSYSSFEGKLNSDTTLFVKANLSRTKNSSLDETSAEYKELSLGLAYRPINLDWLNLLAKYSYLEDDAPQGQDDIDDIEKERAHVLSGEAVVDLTPKWQWSQKLALKIGEEKISGFDFTSSRTWLCVSRINYNINSDWQIGGEYRILSQEQAEDQKQGFLFEVARDIGEYVQVGIGYNFTEFNDDLTNLDYKAHGPFIRFTGKFYDRSPEEIKRARQKKLEEKIKQWVWELVHNELVKPDSPIVQELYRYYYLAEEFKGKGKLNQAKECYEKSLQIGRMIYAEAEEYVRGRIKLEKKLKEDNQLALKYYHQGRLVEAKQLWQKVKQEAEPEPISMEVQR